MAKVYLKVRIECGRTVRVLLLCAQLMRAVGLRTLPLAIVDRCARHAVVISEPA